MVFLLFHYIECENAYKANAFLRSLRFESKLAYTVIICPFFFVDNKNQFSLKSKYFSYFSGSDPPGLTRPPFSSHPTPHKPERSRKKQENIYFINTNGFQNEQT